MAYSRKAHTARRDERRQIEAKGMDANNSPGAKTMNYLDTLPERTEPRLSIVALANIRRRQLAGRLSRELTPAEHKSCFDHAAAEFLRTRRCNGTAW